ncbi:3-ketoacyl-ACP reductase [Chloroflexota bacterium]|nr:3-ketoacyl-ACP reductase [Chloroflexota bacterium]
MDKKVAIVTGASRGIGQGIAYQLAKVGWQVAINDISSVEKQAGTLEMVRDAGSDGITIQGDITKAADREFLNQTVLDTYGRIDMLVNNAGIGPRVRMDMMEMSEESMREVLEVNIYGTFFLSQLTAKNMMKLIEAGTMQSGKIVNISSISAYTSSTSRAEYCISKAAVSMMTKLYADRLAEEGINVYEIRPGIIKTPLTEIVSDKYDKLIAEGVTPIKRWGYPEDIGLAIAAIASGYFPFSTGQVFNIDGGFHIQRL